MEDKYIECFQYIKLPQTADLEKLPESYYDKVFCLKVLELPLQDENVKHVRFHIPDKGALFYLVYETDYETIPKMQTLCEQFFKEIGCIDDNEQITLYCPSRITLHATHSIGIHYNRFYSQEIDIIFHSNNTCQLTTYYNAFNKLFIDDIIATHKTLVDNVRPLINEFTTKMKADVYKPSDFSDFMIQNSKKVPF